MTSSWNITAYVRFMVGAIAEKYRGVVPDQVASLVAASVECCRRASDSLALRALARPIGDVEDDVLNQVLTLNFIERFSDDPDLVRVPLSTLHMLTSANSSELTRRCSEEVADYQGRLPTPLSEIDARFDELQLMVRTLANEAIGTTESRNWLLAHVFAAIIRIHYYGDGNGRLARFTVQYLSRRWKGPLIIIPKVRNDPDWKFALEQGVAGNIEPLAQQFAVRLLSQEGGKC